MNPTLYANVILPLPVSGTFTYRVPAELEDTVRVGVRVVVQFGSRKIYTALVRSVHQIPPEGAVPKLILSVLDDTPLISEIRFRFWEWIASYYMCHLGEVMQAALPSVFKLASESRVVIDPDYDGDAGTLNEKEIQLLEALEYRKTISVSDVMKLLDQQKVIPLIQTLIGKGVIRMEEELKERYKPRTEVIVSLAEELISDETKLRDLFDHLEKKAPKQLALLMTFLQQTRFTPGTPAFILRSDLLKSSPGSPAALKALTEKKILNLKVQPVLKPADPGERKEPEPVGLTEAQQSAVESIRSQWQSNEVVLLHGVTSSGKTEIYIHLIQETLRAGKQVLYLLPEIALTTQIISRLTRYFGERVGVFHSRYHEQERAGIWNQTLNGQFDIILGARSALFAPFSDLGLVVVDEEHDSSFKQQDPAPRYNGRDAALMLAHLYGARVILGSATPSLESYFNARQGKYGLTELFTRYGDILLPEIRVVDIRRERRKGAMKTHFSEDLIRQLTEALARKEQAILFQNRRGFSLRLECEDCHWMPSCKNCDVTLVYHKKGNQLRCHYCGFVSRIPEICPECRGNRIRMRGFGTERVEEDLQILLPNARIVRMDLDTTRSKHALQQIITDFEQRKIDILVGTQMVTKGLDFDHVSTVAILNADNMLSYPDFRSAEQS